MQRCFIYVSIYLVLYARHAMIVACRVQTLSVKFSHNLTSNQLAPR